MKVMEYILENPNKRVEVFDGAISYSVSELNKYLLNADIVKVRYHKPTDNRVRSWVRDLYMLFI